MPRTTSDPKTEFIVCRFTVSEAADIDAAASMANLRRSEWLRDAVRRVIAADKKRAARLKTEGTES